ncbi:RcnB family protein [Parvularcula marina]|uniref:RcnB family protein n=1 Tax=Parvularcula marina TaxID=2292771 RepID=UPI0035181C90
MKPLMISAISALSLGALSVSATAYADPPHCPPGHAKKGWCDNDRYDDSRDERRAYEEGYRDGQRDAIRYGDRYYRDYRVIEDYERYGLRAPRGGYYYAQLDTGEIVMVAIASQLITEFLD